MKIKNIQAFPLHYLEPHFNNADRYITLARIETEDGTVGWGEGIAQFREAALAVKVIIDQGLAPLLIGEEAIDVERLWHKMQDRICWYGPEGIAAFGVSALDMALWDIKGKLLGLPISKLIGGQIRDRIPAMASFVFNMADIDWMLNEFRWMCDHGYWFVKAGWGFQPDALFGHDRARDIEFARRIREVIGDTCELVVDTPGIYRLWDVPTAIQRFHDLEPYRLAWIEQPLFPSDLEGHARLRAAVSTPIGTGEDEWGLESYRHLIRSGGADILQLDPGRCHGITGLRNVIKLVEAENLQYSMHSWTSALNTAASVHLMAISKQGVSMDFKSHDSPMQHELVRDPWVQEDGWLAVRDEPGLGVQVREEIIEKYLFL